MDLSGPSIDVKLKERKKERKMEPMNKLTQGGLGWNLQC